MIEIESKYEILEEDFNEFSNKFKDPNFLRGYILSDITEKNILDIYFDFEDLALDKIGSSLRIRFVNDEHVKITLKVSENRDASVYEREEIEDFLSVDSLRYLLERLSEVLNIKFDYTPTLIDYTYYGICKILNDFGMHEKFQLLNTRIIRNVYKENQKIGEISLDSILYQIGHQTNRQYELETEVLNSNLKQHVVEISELLVNLFPYLKPSVKSKYARGLELRDTQEYHKLEAKIVVPNRQVADKIYRTLRDETKLNEFIIGIPTDYNIKDNYLDFNNNLLYSNNAYLRIRKIEGRTDELTFRDFRFSAQDQIIDGKQIKGQINQGKLLEVLDYLVSKRVLDRSVLRIQNDNVSFLQFVSELGLEILLNTKIHRYLFPIKKDIRHVASLKLDYVEFEFNGKSKDYYEIELSAETDSQESKRHLTLLAMHLNEKFGLASTNNPKIYIGMALINDEDLSDMIGKKTIPILHTRINLSYYHLMDFRQKNDEEKERMYSESMMGYSELVKGISTMLSIQDVEGSNIVDTNNKILKQIQELVQSSNDNQNKKKEWLELVGKGELEEVFDELLEHYTTYGFEKKLKEIVQLKFRYYSAKKDKTLGTISNDNTAMNQIVNSLIDLITKI